MQAVISKATLIGIGTARGLQVTKGYTRGSIVDDQFARIAINNGIRIEMGIASARLVGWVKLLASESLAMRVAEPDEDGRRWLELSSGGSMVRLADCGVKGAGSYDKEGLFHLTPIEIDIVDGEAVLAELPDVSALKSGKKELARTRKKEKLLKQLEKLMAKLNRAQWAVKHGNEKLAKAKRTLREGSLQRAVAFARKVRAAKSAIREIRRELENLPEARMFGWMTDKTRVDKYGVAQNDVLAYETSKARYIEAVRKRDNYSPKSWGRRVGDERLRRSVAAVQAKRNLERAVMDSYRQHIGAEVFDAADSKWQYRNKGYAGAHDYTRQWPKERKSIEAEIAGLKIDIKLVKKQLDKLDSNVL
jgi:hypothetical protein